MSDRETAMRVIDVVADAEEPLSASAIQRRLATRSRDVTTGTIRDVCRDLAEESRIAVTDDLPPKYRLCE